MARKIMIPIETIVELHKAGYSDLEISKLLDCTRANITKRLNGVGITGRKSKIENVELRNRISESLVGRFVGEDNPNYKGYLTEKQIARGIFKTFSKRAIRNSNYTCCNCNKRGGNLHTHHIKPFKLIFSEFITTKYSKNIDSCYNELMEYDDFINENNLVVLCEDCHYKVHYTDNTELSPYRYGKV